MYHAISENSGRDWGPWRYAISPATFEEQVATLARNHRIVPISHVVSYIGDGMDIDRSAAVITFDDGYADIIYEALPILEKSEIPATV